MPFLADPPAPTRGLDPEVLRALGGVARLEELDLADWPGYLAALPDAGEALPLSDSLAVWRGLGAVASRAAGRELDELPDRLPGLRAGRATCAHAEDLAVASSAMWAQARTVVPVAAEAGGRAAGEALADLLDLPLLPAPGTHGVPCPTTTAPQAVDARVVALVPGVPTSWFEHDALSVGGVEVDWWVCAGRGGPQVHASTTSGLARGLAAAAGRPLARHLLEAALLDPGSTDDLLAETAWDGRTSPHDRNRMRGPCRGKRALGDLRPSPGGWRVRPDVRVRGGRERDRARHRPHGDLHGCRDRARGLRRRAPGDRSDRGDVPAGAFAARFGDRRAMMTAAAASIVGLVACALAPNLWVLGAGCSASA
ncbi:hypothetical protein NKG05_18840 [Oerskovia sp. M15]